MLRRTRNIFTILTLVVVSAGTLFAQVDNTRTLTNGQKYKIEGTVIARSNSTLLVRDATGVSTKVVLLPDTSIKTNGFWGGDKQPSTAIVRGLFLKAEGRGDNNGSLAATKIRFDKSDLETAQSIDSRVGPAEERITATEQNAARLSGQIDELMAISNAAKGGAKAAQETADAAIDGVNATNSRISSLDDFVLQSTSTVNFASGSSRLSPEARMELDNLAATALTLRGYILEVQGFASADGDPRKNKILSEKRAKAVIDYLIQTHDIPLRRIGQAYGYGESKAVADNGTRAGRAENRRVEVHVLVSRGINQNVEIRKADGSDD